jgi:hypothetical protein
VPFAWFVALRYLRDGKSQTALILAAVSVGVAVVVFLSALIGGLQISLVDKTLGSQAHVTLQVPREVPRVLVTEGPGRAIARKIQPASQRLRSIDGWQAVLAALDGDPEVVSASPMVVGAGFAMRADAKEAVFIQGVDPERFLGIIDLRQSMVAGRFDILGGQVVLGATLAEDLDVGVGDKVRITSTEGIDDVVTVAGLFTLGNEGVDKTWLITSLRHAQSLYALPGGVTTIELKVGDVFDAERVALGLHDRTGAGGEQLDEAQRSAPDSAVCPEQLEGPHPVLRGGGGCPWHRECPGGLGGPEDPRDRDPTRRGDRVATGVGDLSHPGRGARPRGGVARVGSRGDSGQGVRERGASAGRSAAVSGGARAVALRDVDRPRDGGGHSRGGDPRPTCVAHRSGHGDPQCLNPSCGHGG